MHTGRYYLWCMETRTTRDPEHTRSVLLEAAFKEIYENGFQAASLERILSNTNLTKGALYHHFPNKRALGIAVIREIITENIVAKNVAPLEDTDDPIPMMTKFIEHNSQAPAWATMQYGCPLNNLIQEMSPLDDEFRHHLQQVQFIWHKAISDALERGQAKGNVRTDVDCEEVAMFIVAAVEGCIGTAKNLQSREAYSSCMNQLKRYVENLAA